MHLSGGGMIERDVESGRLMMPRNSRMRGIFYFLTLGAMIGLLMIVQLHGAKMESREAEGSQETYDIRAENASAVIQGGNRSTVEVGDSEEIADRDATLEELQDEVDELLESVEDTLEGRQESEANLYKILEDGEETNSTSSTEEDRDDMPLTEKFKTATVTYDSLRERLSDESIMKLQALELQSVLGDCDANPSSGVLFKTELEQRVENIDIDDEESLKEMWCNFKGISKRDAMRAYIKRVAYLHAPEDELNEIVKMENDYEAYLSTKEGAQSLEEASNVSTTLQSTSR
mmetsp:Transcript_2002/g.5989  ORF Transcript_2002/g.5989 Transcript_2002/m.5989 type:complete len:290 (+) Transcript_2002:245-1114(+)